MEKNKRTKQVLRNLLHAGWCLLHPGIFKARGTGKVGREPKASGCVGCSFWKRGLVLQSPQRNGRNGGNEALGWERNARFPTPHAPAPRWCAGQAAHAHWQTDACVRSAKPRHRFAGGMRERRAWPPSLHPGSPVSLPASLRFLNTKRGC